MAPRKTKAVKQTHREYSDEVKQQVVAAYRAGGLAKDITKQFGLTTSSLVYKWADKASLPVAAETSADGAKSGGGRGFYTEDFKRKVVAAYFARKPGEGARHVAQRLGVKSVGRIFIWARKYGGDPMPAEAPVQPAESGALVSRQTQMFNGAPTGDPLINRVEPHVSPHSVERLKNELGKLHKRLAVLEEDNAILRAIASVAYRRGVLNLFGAKGDEET